MYAKIVNHGYFVTRLNHETVTPVFYSARVIYGLPSGFKNNQIQKDE